MKGRLWLASLAIRSSLGPGPGGWPATVGAGPPGGGSRSVAKIRAESNSGQHLAPSLGSSGGGPAGGESGECLFCLTLSRLGELGPQGNGFSIPLSPATGITRAAAM